MRTCSPYRVPKSPLREALGELTEAQVTYAVTG